MLRLSSAERTPSDSGFRLQELLDLRLREHLALRDDLAVHEKRRRSHDARLGYRTKSVTYSTLTAPPAFDAAACALYR